MTILHLVWFFAKAFIARHCAFETFHCSHFDVSPERRLVTARGRSPEWRECVDGRSDE
jgi:hypothetical protein